MSINNNVDVITRCHPILMNARTRERVDAETKTAAAAPGAGVSMERQDGPCRQAKPAIRRCADGGGIVALISYPLIQEDPITTWLSFSHLRLCPARSSGHRAAFVPASSRPVPAVRRLPSSCWRPSSFSSSRAAPSQADGHSRLLSSLAFPFFHPTEHKTNDNPRWLHFRFRSLENTHSLALPRLALLVRLPTTIASERPVAALEGAPCHRYRFGSLAH